MLCSKALKFDASVTNIGRDGDDGKRDNVQNQVT